MEPRETVYVKPGGSLNLSCSAVGFPFPHVIWLRNGNPLIQDRNIPGVRVPSKTTVVKDNFENGTFTCTGENEFGKQSATVEVVVTGDNDDSHILKS